MKFKHSDFWSSWPRKNPEGKTCLQRCFIISSETNYSTNYNSTYLFSISKKRATKHLEKLLYETQEFLPHVWLYVCLELCAKTNLKICVLRTLYGQ